MIADKKEFFGGAAMLVGFFIVLIIMFCPIFEGKNALNYLDSLYNSISKGSAYYIPKLKNDVAGFVGDPISVVVEMKDEKQAEETAILFTKAGAEANVSGNQLSIKGDFKKIMENCLDDSDNMFNNNGSILAEKYGYPEKNVMYNWHSVCKVMEVDLVKQKRVKAAKIITSVSKKAIECSYNYYKVVPQKISEKAGIVVFSLVFYVVYTMWYGFGILFMFEGWGLKLEH
ncbi:MAG: hypothetical protein FP814_15475 [Desulfobacterium sp.]|nr:hypothetical protein [Desulfobacterium sp.]MBU3947466.1 hypothetical protein [Pseudomonadota bacterium]